MSTHHSYKTEIKKIEETSELEIKSAVSAEEFKEAIEHTLANIKADATLTGFRKGAAPEKLVREKIGDAALLGEAAEHAISHAYMHIIEEEKLDVIGAPQVQITKIAEGNDLEFTLRTAIIPKLGKFDYKEIASTENKKPLEKIETSDEEFKKLQEKMPDIKKEDVVKQNEYKAKEKKRLELVEALTGSINIVIPEILIESELKQMSAQMKADIERMGLSFADYLKHLNKTEDDLKKEWRKDAEKRVKLEIAIGHISEVEKIIPDKQKIDTEVKAAMKQHEGLDEERASNYFTHLFQNQAVFEFLESEK